ncbi:MAG TPA: amidase, partial [Microscillaceae bacterium]|nr:amidase [Microscillaceae bacterium]
TDEATLQKMRDVGFELVPISLPDLPVRSISFILWAEADAAFDELTLTNQDDQMVRQIKNAWPNFFRRARFVPAVEYIKANRLRTLLMEAMQQTLQNVDVYLAPSWVGPNLTLTNLTGHPCVVLPNGFSAQGTPQSITFVGKLLGEAELLLVAKTYQEATDFHLQHPEWLKR